MCADCCFNLAATLAAAALTIGESGELPRPAPCSPLALLLSPWYQEKSQQTAGEVWRKITVFTCQPVRLLLLLGGGQCCVKKTVELGGRLCIMPVWGVDGEWGCACTFFYFCPCLKWRFIFLHKKDGWCFWSVFWIWSRLAHSWIRFTTLFNIPRSKKEKKTCLLVSVYHQVWYFKEKNKMKGGKTYKTKRDVRQQNNLLKDLLCVNIN